TAWPDLEVDELLFIEHLALRLPPDGTLAAVHATDLYLAFACLLGDPLALEHLDRGFLRQVRPALERLPPGLTIDEVQQTLRQKLLMRNGESAPKIGDYSGRGALLHWVRAAAVRIAQDIARARNLEVALPDEALAQMPSPAPDAELAYVKSRFGAQFKAAFQDALAGLDQRDRNLLRLHYLDGINPDEMGRIYRVHRTTVWRWLTQAREDVFKQTRRLLTERLPLEKGELASLMNLVCSQLDVSISRLLRDK
ncbi:MAG: sigma factor-like helix-turn-helix DNA-binding protein, partial [Myxococcaceae bacterium]